MPITVHFQPATAAMPFAVLAVGTDGYVAQSTIARPQSWTVDDEQFAEAVKLANPVMVEPAGRHVRVNSCLLYCVDAPCWPVAAFLASVEQSLIGLSVGHHPGHVRVATGGFRGMMDIVIRPGETQVTISTYDMPDGTPSRPLSVVTYNQAVSVDDLALLRIPDWQAFLAAGNQLPANPRF